MINDFYVFDADFGGNKHFAVDFDNENLREQNLQFLECARQNLLKSELARRYFEWRGVHADFAGDLQKAGGFIGFCDKGANSLPCVIYGVQNEKGEIQAIQWRNIVANDFAAPPELNGVDYRVRTNGGVKSGFLGLSYLLNAKSPCFIVEGIFDYLAIREQGYSALALIGTGGANAFADFLKNKTLDSPLILGFDFDTAKHGDPAKDSGGQSERKLRNKLKNRELYNGIRVCKRSLFHGEPADLLEFLMKNKIKDACELLQYKLDVDFFGKGLLQTHLKSLFDYAREANCGVIKDGFDEKVDAPPPPAANAPAANAPAANANANASAVENEKKDIKFDPTIACYESFANEIAACVAAGAYATPFAALNKIYNGGFQQSELYALAAPPAMGKTALALQIADFVAASGKKVLYFSLEMQRTALMRRSLCRLSYARDYDNGYSTMAIKQGKMPDSLLESLWAEAEAAWKNLFIVECTFAGFSTLEMRDYVEKFVNDYGEPPLIIVDYFQILQAGVQYNNDKQKADAMIFDLKKIATDFKAPLLFISAVSRAKYDSKPAMDALKESGALEYTSDSIMIISIPLGLDSFNAAKKDFAKAREKEIKTYYENLRTGQCGELQISVVKNRESSGGKVPLFFNAARSTFYEEHPLLAGADLKMNRVSGVDFESEMARAAVDFGMPF